MIETGVQPGRGGVAHRTVLREPSLRMIRICRAVVVLGVAAETGRRCARELSADMAGGAFQCGVHAGEGEAGELQVIELRTEPGIHGVTHLAGGRKVHRTVIEVWDGVLLGVARVAIRAESDKLPGSGVRVAILALQGRVGAYQREAILVILDRLQVHLPAFHRVARFAIGAELSAMKVGMTIGAPHSHLCEHHVCVTLLAADVYMHATQPVTRFVVIELRDRAQGAPGRKGMAVLTRHVETAVRAHDFRAWGRLLRLRRHCQQQQR